MGLISCRLRPGLLSLLPALPVVVVESTSKTRYTLHISLYRITTDPTGQNHNNLTRSTGEAGSINPSVLRKRTGRGHSGPLSPDIPWNLRYPAGLPPRRSKRSPPVTAGDGPHSTRSVIPRSVGTAWPLRPDASVLIGGRRPSPWGNSGDLGPSHCPDWVFTALGLTTHGQRYDTAPVSRRASPSRVSQHDRDGRLVRLPNRPDYCGAMTDAHGSDEDGDVDPLSTGLAKIAASAGVEGAKEGSKLLNRVLGPSADVIGEALARYTDFRLKNVGVIVEKAHRKSRAQGDGEVPPRVAHRLLEEGSYCDDELMAEYLGGVLAASRTPAGRDDRAVVWSALVNGLSTLQLRGHFLLYREWARHLHGRDLVLAAPGNRLRTIIHADLLEFSSRLLGDDDSIPQYNAVSHAIPGLVRAGLLDINYTWGNKADIDIDLHQPFREDEFDPILCVNLTVVGIELYGWAQGRDGLTPEDFISDAEVFAEDVIEPLVGVSLPELDRVGEKPMH